MCAWHPDDVERIAPFTPTFQTPGLTWRVEDVDKITPFTPISTWKVEDVDKIESFVPTNMRHAVTTPKGFSPLNWHHKINAAPLQQSDNALSSCSSSPSLYDTASSGDSFGYSPSLQSAKDDLDTSSEFVSQNSLGNISSCSYPPYKSPDKNPNSHYACDNLNAFVAQDLLHNSSASVGDRVVSQCKKANTIMQTNCFEQGRASHVSPASDPPDRYSAESPVLQHSSSDLGISAECSSYPCKPVENSPPPQNANSGFITSFEFMNKESGSRGLDRSLVNGKELKYEESYLDLTSKELRALVFCKSPVFQCAESDLGGLAKNETQDSSRCTTPSYRSEGHSPLSQHMESDADKSQEFIENSSSSEAPVIFSAENGVAYDASHDSISESLGACGLQSNGDVSDCNGASYCDGNSSAEEDEPLPVHQEEVEKHSDKLDTHNPFAFSHTSIAASQSFGRGKNLAHYKSHNIQEHQKKMDNFAPRGRGTIVQEYFNRRSDEMLHEQLRMAVGDGFSNELIEQFWRNEQQEDKENVQKESDTEALPPVEVDKLVPSEESLPVSPTASFAALGIILVTPGKTDCGSSKTKLSTKNSTKVSSAAAASPQNSADKRWIAAAGTSSATSSSQLEYSERSSPQKKPRKNRNALMLSLANKKVEKKSTGGMPPGAHTYVDHGISVSHPKEDFLLDSKDFPPLGKS